MVMIILARRSLRPWIILGNIMLRSWVLVWMTKRKILSWISIPKKVWPNLRLRRPKLRQRESIWTSKITKIAEITWTSCPKNKTPNLWSLSRQMSHMSKRPKIWIRGTMSKFWKKPWWVILASSKSQPLLTCKIKNRSKLKRIQRSGKYWRSRWKPKLVCCQEKVLPFLKSSLIIYWSRSSRRWVRLMGYIRLMLRKKSKNKLLDWTLINGCQQIRCSKLKKPKSTSIL